MIFSFDLYHLPEGIYLYAYRSMIAKKEERKKDLSKDENVCVSP